MKRLSAGEIREARLGVARGGSVAQAVSTTSPGAITAHDLLARGRELRVALGAFGPEIQPLIDDSNVTDILINGRDGVWVDRGAGLEHVIGRLDAGDVRAMAVRMAAAAGQRLDDASPIVDGTFEDGLRLHAVLPPIAAEGALISLRTQRTVTFSLEDLTANGMVPGEMRPVVDALVARRANVIISGATGSGKTTLLAACLAEVSAAERILVIEESAELRPRHPHVVHLQVRYANVQGAGEVSMSSLVRAAMRMRPDRIVLGECRGAEVRDVLSALNTGHEGGWATIHANSALDVPARLVALGALAGMSESVLAAQASSALDAVIHLERTAAGRRVSEVAVLERQHDELRAIPALSLGGERCVGWTRLARRLGMRA